jgi:hypothetical protein
MSMPLPIVDEEIAFHFIVRCLREQYRPVYSNYGYDLYVTNVVDHFLLTVVGYKDIDGHARMAANQISQHFFNAAWELARRGVVRPGVKGVGQQGTDAGRDGGGFAITPLGHKWLAESGSYDFVPIEPGRFAKQLSLLAPTFGEGFEERAHEAIRCYSALSYLACCAMCGAAAESIILAIGVAKSRDTAATEKLYLSSGGRGRLEKQITSVLTESLQNELKGYMSLLKYWRDSAAHGRRAGIGDSEAYTSLALLLRFAQFATDRWADLTSTRA